MQWAYYWYYSALGCHGHLVRDIQFSLFHHHYLWGHLLWKMNSASFAWLISNFFFYLFNRRSYAGDLELVKKKSGKKKRAWERKSGAVCIRGWMWRWSRSLRPTSLSYCMCHSCPDDIFFPLSYCTQNRATERESFSPQPSWRPPGFSPIVGGCISIFFFFDFLDCGLWNQCSLKTKAAFPASRCYAWSSSASHLWGKGFSLSVCFEPAQLPKLNLPSLVSGAGMVWGTWCSLG